MTVIWVFLAGGLGSAARYVIGLSAAAAFGVAFPYGTLIVNLAGCFALGMVVQLAIAGAWHNDVRAALAAGFLGGFTTYSSFNYQLVELLRAREWLVGGAYLAATVVLGLAAGVAGLGAGRWLASA